MLSCVRRVPVLLHERVLPARCLVRTLASLPLCETTAVCAVSLASVRRWREWAAKQAVATGDGLAEDGGPTAAELLKELDWLLDDAVESCRQGRSPLCKAWRNMQQCSGDCEVALRVELRGLSQLWRRRIEQREPLQYLCNVAHWRDVTLAVGEGVLIPRPETELLIDFAQEALVNHPELRGGTWADLGTGSGALAIGLASILPRGCKVLAVDCSSAAQAWAELNVRRLKVGSMVEVVGGNWYSPLLEWRGQLCGVLSNPPYIKSEEVPQLQAEVKLHEPRSALDGGATEGLDCLLEVCRGAVHMLRPRGFLAVETAGGKQAVKLASVLEALPDDREESAFVQVRIRNDLFGVQRFVTAHRRSCCMP